MAHKRPDRHNNPFIPTQVTLVNAVTKELIPLSFGGLHKSAEELDWASKSPLQKLWWKIKEYLRTLLWPEAPQPKLQASKSIWYTPKTCSGHYVIVTFSTLASAIQYLMPNHSICYLVLGDSITIDIKDPVIKFTHI